MGGVVAALAEHAFEHLFIECLGWDRLRGMTAVTRHDATLNLTTAAQKRGFTVFHCQARRTILANRLLLRDVQRRIRRSHHEHILVYSCETPRKQVWHWATVLADGRRILEHPFFSSDPPNRLIERSEGLTATAIFQRYSTRPRTTRETHNHDDPHVGTPRVAHGLERARMPKPGSEHILRRFALLGDARSAWSNCEILAQVREEQP